MKINIETRLSGLENAYILFSYETKTPSDLPPISIGITISNLTVYIHLFHIVFGSAERNRRLLCNMFDRIDRINRIDMVKKYLKYILYILSMMLFYYGYITYSEGLISPRDLEIEQH